jgi:hypothetical protein
MNEVYDNILCPLGCNNILSGTEIPVTVRNTTGGRDFQLDNTGGVITGTVTRANGGAPIQNVTVTAVTRVGTSLFTRNATTNASGVYRLAGLTPGTYWLYTSNTSTWVNEIFNDIPCVGTGCNNSAAASLGTPIAVGRGATVSNQNFALVDGGFVSGVVRDSVSGLPIAGQTVELSMQSGAGGTFVTSRQSGADGYFSFGGLTAGTYFLNTAGQNGYQNEIFNNIPCGPSVCSNFGSATPIPVTLGAPFNGRNFDLDPIAGGLRGKITSSATGLPLAGITVNLYQRIGSGVFVGSTITNYRGSYFFSSLPAGTYVVFTSNSLGYRNEIYHDIPCAGACSSSTAASSGQAINLTSTAWTAGIDFALDDAMLWVWKRKNDYKKSVVVFSLALVVTLPWLIYTWSLTGRVFYWGNAGGTTVYWISNPNEGEYGEWFNTQLEPNGSIDGNLPGAHEKLEANHRHIINEIIRHKGVERDDAYKRKGFENIRNHPGKYVGDVLANVSRLLFNYPQSYRKFGIGVLLNALPNLLLVTAAIFLIGPSWRMRKKIPFFIRFLLIVAGIYFAASSLISGTIRMFYILFPILAVWLFYVAHLKKKVNPA